MKRILVLLAFACAIPAFCQDFQPSALVPLDPAVVSGTLSNGLTYFIRHNEKPDDRVELRLAVKTGSTMENDDQQGLAHLIEHMAFNGTKNFQKSELVDYLESIGTAFGPHLNAYTSFDETVYMLQIPTDKPDFISRGMQVLEDWAHNLTFDTTEIDKERGVVIEEWRTRLGANERMRTVYWPVLFKDSRYADRLPIGQTEVIRNAPYEKLTSFYHDWYRPDNMAVVIVGDIDVKEMEEMIRSHFSGIQNPARERKVENWTVADHRDLRIVHATDKEATRASVQVVYKHEVLPRKTVGDFRKQLAVQLYNQMMSSRLSELRKQADPPFNFANTSFGNLVRNKANFRSFAMVSDDGLLRGLETIVRENERVKRFGFTATELERNKKSMLRDYQSAFADRNKNESGNFTYEYLSYFLEGIPSPGIEYELALCEKFLDGITLEEVNDLAKAWITPNQENCTVILLAPEKDDVIVPTDAEVRQVFARCAEEPLESYVDSFIDQPLMPTPPTAGKIVAEERNDELGFKKLTLSNGATVILKKTDFKNDEVVMNAIGFGGRCTTDDRNDLNARMSSYIASSSGLGVFNQEQLDKMMQGKIARIYPYVSDYTVSMNGNASPLDLELWLQQLYLRFTSVRTDSSAFASFVSQQKTSLKNKAVDPSNTFRDSVQVVMSMNHPRRQPMTMEMMDDLDLGRSLKSYSNMFSNAADFNFVFVGNFDEAVMLPLIEKYIASLPSSNTKTNWADMGIRPPTGPGTKIIKKGIEPKSAVQIIYTGMSESTSQERIQLQALTKLMQIKLRESLREDASGTYGVGCYGGINRIPTQDFSVTISFQCDPANVEMLVAAANEVIRNVQQNGCSDEDLTKVIEGLRRARETQLQENNYWASTLSNAALYGEEVLNDKMVEDIFSSIHSESLKASAVKYFDTHHRREFVLMPE